MGAPVESDPLGQLMSALYTMLLVLRALLLVAGLGGSLWLLRRNRPAGIIAGLGALLLLSCAAGGAAINYATGHLLGSGSQNMQAMIVANQAGAIVSTVGHALGLVLLSAAAITGRSSWYEDELRQPLPGRPLPGQERPGQERPGQEPP